MSERAADSVLEIHRVQTVRRDAEGVRLRLAGRWLDAAAEDEEELLVVEVDGRRHRFVGERDRSDSTVWSASFSLPAWAEPRRAGQAVLWVGEVAVPVGPVGFVRVPPLAREPAGGALGRAVPVGPAGPPEVVSDRDPVSPPEPVSPPVPVEASPPPPPPEGPRAGPLAEILLRDTITALHAELEQRAGETARLRAELADARSELQVRGERHAALDAAQSALRAELQRLNEAVEGQRAELESVEEERDRLARERDRLAQERDRLAAAGDELTVERDSLRGELDRLLAERDRLAGELDELAAEHDAWRLELGSLRRQAAGRQAVEEGGRAEVGRVRAELAAALVARDAAAGEAAALRAELERLGRELVATQERVRAESGELGEANRLLEEARALARSLDPGAR